MKIRSLRQHSSWSLIRSNSTVNLQVNLFLLAVFRIFLVMRWLMHSPQLNGLPMNCCFKNIDSLLTHWCLSAALGKRYGCWSLLVLAYFTRQKTIFLQLCIHIFLQQESCTQHTTKPGLRKSGTHTLANCWMYSCDIPYSIRINASRR